MAKAKRKYKLVQLATGEWARTYNNLITSVHPTKVKAMRVQKKTKNPSITEVATDWIPVHAIRKVGNDIQVMTEKGTLGNPGKKKKLIGQLRKLFSQGTKKILGNPGEYEDETIYLQRIKLNKEGYTTGKYPKYFGVGSPLYHYELYKQGYDNYLRANSRSEAISELKNKYPGAKIK